MDPYQHTVATHSSPVIAWVLLLASIPILLFQVLLITAALDWPPFLTKVFLHGGWLHLILNM